MLWGGRFKKELNKKALEFSSSLKYDIQLIDEDIEGSIAHAKMLHKINILSEDELNKITSALSQILDEWQAKKYRIDPSEQQETDKFEDVHSAIEFRLHELIGDTAGKLHTGRSRNDQVLTAVKLWMRKRCDEILIAITDLQKSFLSAAEKHTETIIPGYTHLQRAQPISFAFHLLAYVEMFERDKQRFKNVIDFIKESPLGAGALAGSTLPLDREYTARLLGFESPTPNALDTVSDRDFILDFLHASVSSALHLSRLAEELIIWSTAEWKFISIDDSLTTGSSLMPQKKNPDLAELIRAKSGRVLGNYVTLSTVMKALPLSYNRDLQEDKQPLFDSAKTVIDSLQIMKLMIDSLEINTKRFVDELNGDYMLATDLADWLLLKGIPFRKAHEIIGELVKHLEREKKKFNEIESSELQKFSPLFDEAALECLNIQTSLARKKTYGSPNPNFVNMSIKMWKDKLR
jgi:argininosuccinate lyase